MLHAKIFSSGSPKTLEAELNDWFTKNPRVEIVTIVQTESQKTKDEEHALTLSLIYKLADVQ
jgi:hypothetical protein